MDSHKIIPYSEIRNKERLDRGQFGQVFKAEYNELTVAAKEIEPCDNGQEFIQTFRREVEINSQLHHENVVKFYGACFQPYCIIMEYVEGGSLYNWIYKTRFHFGNENIRNILVGMTSGLKYLHDLKILHRDLKSKNVLIVPGCVLGAKLCDFGVSKTLNATMNVNTQEIGTVRWMAPEVMISNTYNYKCDIYSLGITIYEILEMDLPYRNEENYRIMMMKAVEKKTLQLSECATESSHPIFASVFSKCVQFDPKSRPVLLDILLKLQNSDLSNVCDATLEVDEDTRYAWELQQQEYASLEIITQADETYALELQQRFYAQNIRPYYRHSDNPPPRKRKDRGIEFSTPYGITPLPTQGNFTPVGEDDYPLESHFQIEPTSPGLNLEFIYGPQSIPDVLEDNTPPLEGPKSDEPVSEPYSSGQLIGELVNLRLAEPEDYRSFSDTQFPISDTIVSPPKTNSPRSTPPMRVIKEDTNFLSCERHHLDQIAKSPSVVKTRVGSFVNLNCSGSSSDLDEGDSRTLVLMPGRAEKSRSMEPLNSKRSSSVMKFLRRLDPRSKSPDLARDRMLTYTGTKPKQKTHELTKAQSCDVANLTPHNNAPIQKDHGIYTEELKFSPTEPTSEFLSATSQRI